ncbi:hypothetical protein GW17_00034516 [Ensete ventricosum]|nr:hypothetical protein GW17_00034516 [Ensete ventricosum]
MTWKGLRGLLKSSSSKQDSHQIRHYHRFRRHRVHSAAGAMDRTMEENIAAAEEVVNQWGLEVDASLFSGSGRADSERFLRAAGDLHRSMLFCSSPSVDPAARSASLLHAHSLLSAAMRRLERELHLLLSAHGQRLNPFDPLHSSSNVSNFEDATQSLTQVENTSDVDTADIRAVAETMISAGYGVECVRLYKTMRKSFVDESVRRLGFERLTQSQIQKFEWEALESKIRDWLAAAPVAFRRLFSGERLLCDSVFAGSDSVRESCFADVTRDAAAQFLNFPELVARSKRSPEKLFRILDLHNAVAELWPDIESMFRFESTAAIRKQAVNSLLRLIEVARSSLADFEAAIQRDASRSLITGGDVHPLTRYVMNYLVFLANYHQTLADIFADLAFEPPSPLPESFFDAPEVATPSSASTTSLEGRGPLSSFPSAAAPGSISVLIAWLVLVLICKLDVKAELYRDVALSYLFLANNIQFIVRKVKESKLRLLLGDSWVARHEAKARHHAASSERLAWGKVAVTEKVREAVTEMVVHAFPEFYEQCRTVLRNSGAVMAEVVRFSPEYWNRCGDSNRSE